MKKSLLTSLVLIALFSTRLFADEISAKENEIEQILIKIHNQVEQGGYELMSVADLKQLIDNKESFVLIDAQPEEHYNSAFIEGAKNVEFQSTFTRDWKADASGTQAAYQELLGHDLNKKIILSCGGLQCERSNTAALWTKKLGYHHVYRVASGIKGWQAAGYPVKSLTSSQPKI